MTILFVPLQPLYLSLLFLVFFHQLGPSAECLTEMEIVDILYLLIIWYSLGTLRGDLEIDINMQEIC